MNKPIIESVAKALIINHLNEVLILKRSEYKEKPDKAFKPDLPGGLTDPGEDEHTAVTREIYEETGIEVDQSAIEMVYSKTQFIAAENKSTTKHLFIVRLDNKPEVKLSWEHIDFEWIGCEKLSMVKLSSFYHEAIKYCLEREIVYAK